AREEQLRKEQEERERAAREEQLRKEQEERERAAREEQLRKEQEERERAAREEQLKKTKQENQGSKTSGAPNLFDIFTPISEAGKQQGTTATVASQVSEKQSLNDLLQSRNPEKPTIYSKMHDAKIEDLAKAISLNDKFLFIKELFRNQGEDFSKAIITLNQCANLEEAFEELEKMKKFYFWDSVSPAYLSLCDLVRRRFS
ncbi:MAG: hypothetical protein MJZ76_06025, partial [Bacteroidales bacterium]|nr:hypothetical protein [Bacteroidales bacterium]